MPTYVDRHAVSDVDSATRYRLHLEAVEGIRDPNGTLPLSHWVDDGSLYCLLQAPTAEAVRRHHEARGIRADDLHLLADLSGSRPLTGKDEALLRAEIARIWHGDSES